MGVLENKISGRRTNQEDYQIVWPELANSSSDPSMNRVEALFNSSFDFGKPYKASAASSVGGAGMSSNQSEFVQEQA
jgi:GH18 family chitinase